MEKRNILKEKADAIYARVISDNTTYTFKELRYISGKMLIKAANEKKALRRGTA